VSLFIITINIYVSLGVCVKVDDGRIGRIILIDPTLLMLKVNIFMSASSSNLPENYEPLLNTY